MTRLRFFGDLAGLVSEEGASLFGDFNELLVGDLSDFSEDLVCEYRPFETSS